MKKYKNIGIIGAGSMGIGIAQIAASVDCKVLLYDQNKNAAKSSLIPGTNFILCFSKYSCAPHIA